MPLPKYDDLMLPLLTLLGDGQEHRQRDLAPQLAAHFNLTPEEEAEQLPNSPVNRFRHRIGWAGFHLRYAGLASLPEQGSLKITDSGKAFLATSPEKITRKVLMQFEPWKEYMRQMKSGGSPGTTETEIPVNDEDAATPEERIGSAFSELRKTLTIDLLARLSTVNPFRFEQIVIDLLVKMGYGGSRKEAAAVTQKTGDEGIDGVINEDRLGLDVIYVQAKRWASNVGRPEIQNFVGALAGKKANKGVFITTSAFHNNAREYAAGLHQKVILIDGERLADLMIEHGIGVAEEHAYVVKKIDSDYFEEA